MKKHLLLLGACVAFFSFKANAQNVLAGSNMEDASKWKVSYANSVDSAKFTFNYSTDKPALGSGNCLHITCASTTTNTQTVFYQEVTLQKGKTYNLKGAYKDLSSISKVNFENWWLEAYIEGTEPGATSDWGTSGGIIAGFKYSTSWGADNGKDIDGTFQTDASATPVKAFTVPGTSGDTTMYFGFKTGIWNGSATAMGFDIVVDEITFELATNAGIVTNKTNVSSLVVDNNQLKISNIKPSTVVIYNMTGQVVKMVNNINTNANINITDLPNGLYIVKSANYTSKFVKK